MSKAGQKEWSCHVCFVASCDVELLSIVIYALSSPTESCRCQKQLHLANHARPFFTDAYTESDNTL